MTTNKPKCANCEKSGLAILPVRYSVLPVKVKAVIPPGISGARVTDVVLEHHHYGLRTLREGWIYLFYEAGPRGKRYWEVYKVTPDGLLWKQTLPLPRVPITHPACAQRAIAVPMELIAIENPEKCTGRVFIAFSEHTWHKEVFDRYASDNTLMQARMQFIKPAEWIGSGRDTNGHAIVATEKAIDSVIEYMPGFDPRLLALPDEKHPFSNAKGEYNDSWLQHEVTRYPTYIRQASPDSASHALVKLMKQVGAKAQESGNNDSNHPPMMVALWDSIGNVHELNGFRGDPVSWLDLYVTKERALEIGALQGIDTAHAIVQSRTDNEIKRRETIVQQAHSKTALAKPGAQTAIAAQRARALASASPSRAVQINAYYDDLDWIAANQLPRSYQNSVARLGQSTSAGNANASVPYTGEYRDQIMSAARAQVHAHPAKQERDRTSMMKENWSKYEARLKRQDVESFRARYKALQSAVFDLQELRCADVGKWLQAKLFLDALEDYQSTEIVDSIAFEIAITDALAGIGSTPVGQKILDSLVTQWDPLHPSSLIWRVFAMNQKDACIELGKILQIALEKKEVPLEPMQSGSSDGAGVHTVFSAAAVIGKLNGYYGKLAKLALEADAKKISPLGKLFKRLEVDVFGMTVGDAIYRNFRINKISDFVGEKIIQTIFLQRAGISYNDSLNLVRQQAKLEAVSRRETAQRLLTARSLMRTDAPDHAPRPTLALYDTWDQMKSTEDGIKALRSSRIAVVAAFMEALNFYKILTLASDDDTELKLAQSGTSMLSSLIMITMTPYYGVLKNAVRSQSWKLVGGSLGSFGTFISAWIDRGKSTDSFSSQKSSIGFIYGVKAITNAGSGAALIIEATSTAAPLLKNLAKRHGSAVLIAGVETVSKRVIALAALRVVTILTGWEVVVLLLALQAIADWLTPDDLEKWCSECAFGIANKTKPHGSDKKNHSYVEAPEQQKGFLNAMMRIS